MTERERDPVARLQALASVTPPPPSDELADRLSGRALPHRDPAPVKHAHVIRFPVLLPAIAVAALVLGFVVIAFNRSSSGNGSVVLNTAVDASVEKNGVSTVAMAGVKLTDGTVITTGPSGNVRVGKTTLGPGERWLIRQGKLSKLAQETTTTTTPARGADVSPDWERLPVSVQLEGRRLANGAVGFQWTAYQGDDFGGYIVVREDRTIVMRRLRVEAVKAQDTAPPAGRTRYVVVVVDKQRRAVARSEVVSV